MRQLTETTWTIDHPLTVAGLRLGTRTTLIRLPSDRLLMISPVPFDDETADRIDELGEVDTVVAPNLHHHFYFADACRRWPDARVLVPDGLGDKMELPDNAAVMAPEGSIEDTVHWRLVDGAPKIGEHLFVDTQSGVLVITDLAFHFPHHDHWWTRWMMRVNGVYGRLSPSRLIRLLIADGQAMGHSLAQLLEYDWDAVVVAHGEVIETGGRKAFEEAFAKYLA